jgi:class 3 adenylate cyclase/CHAT domain-containing protein/tetratricopeptide (TPR) repeat protein
MASQERSFSPTQGLVQQPPSTPRNSGAKDTEALLRERIQIDALLHEKHRRDVTLLFTDIEGSTAYFAQHGDLSGRQMVQHSNDLLFPIVAQHQGTVLKTIGDGIMASFIEPTAAVQSAIAMQRALRDYNCGREVSEQMHIRIGINSGPGFVETHDVFGDVVNVASRVEACALPDQILLSGATYERLPVSIPCRLLGAADVKGKPTPIELYEVHWDERKTFQETVLLRGPGVIKPPEKILVLEVSWEGDRLKLSVSERWPGEERPVKHYEHLAVSFAALQQDMDAMITLLNRATDHHGTLEAAVWRDIKAKGAALYNRLLTPHIQEKLRSSTATDLLLYIDDALVQMPWELLFDGHTFLCRRFSMGRIVSTQQPLVAGQERHQERTIKMLIVADPQGDLEAAAQEGRTIAHELAAEARGFELDLRSTRVSTPDIKASLAQCDMLHYAGHADYDLSEPAYSGWRLADGKLTARDILQTGKTAPTPALVFCNACRSGQTEAWTISQEAEQGIYGLANAFLLAGAQHYIGTFWEIPDQPSCTFAIDFYRALARGTRVGEALRSARQALAERYGEDSVVWASYVLYGDPTCCYVEAAPAKPLRREDPTAPQARRRGESRRAWSRKSSVLLGAGALVALVVVLAVLVPGRLWRAAPDASALTLGYQALEQGDWPKAAMLFQQLGESTAKQAQGQGYAGLAALALARGDYQQALDFAAQAEALDPEIAYTHVLRGHVLWNQGKLAEAAVEYQIATDKAHSVPWQQAVAYNRLGRLHAVRGEGHKALEHYNRAIGQHPNMAVVYTNKGHLLEQLGQRQEALALYRQALQLSPDDSLAAMLLGEAERRQQAAQDTERQRRIDQLVAELVQAYKEGRPRDSQGDDWTSMPLTLAVLEVQAKGVLSPRAGEDEFLRLRLAQALQASGRIDLLERELLDKLLAELKLSTTDLTEPQGALRVGRIRAARLLATGSFTRFGDAGQLNVRLVETETSHVPASAIEIVHQPGDINGVVEQVARTLLQALRQTYPLQGSLARVTPQGVILNIGVAQGVTTGLVMQVFGPDEALEVNGQVVGYHRTPVGRIKVTSVEARHAQAQVLEQTEVWQPGWKVQEVQSK